VAIRQSPYLLPGNTPPRQAGRPKPQTSTRAAPARPASKPAPVWVRPNNAPSRWRRFGEPAPTLRRPSADAVQAISIRRLGRETGDKILRSAFPEDYRKKESSSAVGKILGGISAPFRFVGGGIKNAADELLPVPEGIARLGYEYGRSVGQLALSPLPGITAKPALDRMSDMTYGVAKGLKDDVVFTYDPLVRGNFREFGKRVYEQPVRTLGTIGASVSAVGGVTGAALRTGGRVTGSQALMRGGSKAITARPGEVAPRRYRAPELIRPVKDQFGRDVLPQAKPVERPMRPRSANPITREIQKNITDPAFSAVRRGVGRIEVKGNPLSDTARYSRAARRDFRSRASQFLENEDQFISNETFDLAKLVRKAPRVRLPGSVGGRKKRAEQAYYTATVRAMGLNNLSKTKKSRTWGRDSLIEKYEAEYARHADTGNPEFAKMAQRNIDALRAIPDEWLDPATAPKFINDLTRETEKVLSDATDIKVTGGIIKPSTAERSGYRMQEIAAGVDEVGMTMRDSIVKQREAASSAVAARGKLAGVEKQIAEVKTQIAANPAKAKSLGIKLKSLQTERSNLRRTNTQASRSEKQYAAAAAESQKIVDDALGGMNPGVYFPNYRQMQRGIRARVGNRATLGSSQRATLPREKKNMNVVANEGTMAFTPDVTFAAIRDAADVRGRARALSRAVDDFVVRGADGKPVTNDAAINLAKNSNNLYVAKTKKELMRILDADARWTEGGVGVGRQNGGIIPAHRVDDAEVDSLMAQLDEMSDGDTKYLIPASAEKGWRDALGARQNVLDDLNQYFKAGVLALSPRWYVQNGLGMSMQFLLGSGADLNAVVTAGLNPRRLWSKAVRERNRLNRERVSPAIEGTGLSSDMGQVAKRMAGRGNLNPLSRIIRAGYRINARLEAIPRRAMFWHMAKKKMKDEGLLNIPAGMKNEARLVEAWDDLARSAARGDKQAEALIDDIVRETDRFMGNYSRYNSFERTILRRVFPFYGWMRAIHRLAFTLPFKYPKRSMVLMTASRMAAEMYNDEESTLVPNYRGIITGENNDRFLQTSIANPYSSVNDTLEAGVNVGETLRDEGIGGLSKIPAELIQAYYPQVSPFLQSIPSIASGSTALNIPVPYSPSADGTLRNPQTGRRYSYDQRGNLTDDVPRASVEQIFGGYFPLYQQARRALAGGEPVADASLASLIRYRKDGRPTKDRWKYVIPKPIMGKTLERDRLRTTTLGILFGTPVWNYNSQNAMLDQVRRFDQYNTFVSDYVNKRLTSQYMP